MILTRWKLPTVRKRRSRYARSRALFMRTIKHSLAGACVYFSIAYVALPTTWSHRLATEARQIDQTAAVCRNRIGFASDPINLQLVGTREQVIAAFTQAHWQTADPISVSAGWRTCRSIAFGEAYPSAPMSDLFLQGRPQDLAFEQPAGQDPSRRHHVRLWDSGRLDPDGRPIWLAAGTMDDGIRLCQFTARFTHRISPDIDAERDKIIADLAAANCLVNTRTAVGIGPTQQGRNGTGDPYFTDGNICISALVAAK